MLPFTNGTSTVSSPANRKRSAVDRGSPASSQQRHCRPRFQTGAQGLVPIQEDLLCPPTDLKFQLSTGTSLGSILSRNDGDTLSVLSAFDSSPMDELFTKYFPKRHEVRALVDADCVERKLLDGCHVISAEDLILEIKGNPRNSALAQIGLLAMGEDEIVLQTSLARWQHAAEGYATKVGECFNQEQALLPAVDAAHSALTKASQDYHSLSVKRGKIVLTRTTFEKHRKHYDRRSKIATNLLEIMQALGAGRDSEKVCHMYPLIICRTINCSLTN
jgi:hypothetical protein